MTRILYQIELRFGRKWRTDIGGMYASERDAQLFARINRDLWHASDARYRKVTRRYAGPGYSNSTDQPDRKPVYI